MKFTQLSFVPPTQVRNDRWLIVRAYPDREDNVLGKPWCGDAGKLFKQVIKQRGMNLDTFAVHHLVPEFQPEGLSKEQILLSASALNETLKRFAPTRILLLGIECVNALYGYGKRKNGRDLSDYRGFYTDYALFPDYVIPTYATYEPRQLLEAPTAFYDDFDGDISRLHQTSYLDTPKVVVVNNIIETGKALRALAFGAEELDDGVRAFDIETTGLDYRVDTLVSLAIGANTEVVYIWPVEVLRQKSVKRALQAFFDDPKLNHVGQNNLAFDCPFLYRQEGINVPSYWDVMYIHYLLDERKRTHGLKRLALRYFGIPNWEKGIVAAKQSQKAKGKKINYGDIDKTVLYPYQGMDVAVTLLLYRRLVGMLTPKLEEVYDKIIYPGARLLENISDRGMLVDVDYLKNLKTEWDEELGVLKSKLEDLVEINGFNPKEFNFNSTQQLAHFIYDILNLPKINAKSVAKTNANKMKDKYDSTSESVLHYLEDKDKSGFIKLLLQYRRLNKFKSNYVDDFLELLELEPVIHPHLLLHVAETGRLSCVKPNMQSFPKHDRDKRAQRGLVPYADQIRNMFIPRPGYKLVSSDYSQIELRVLAYLSRDEAMINAFNSGADFHATTAELAFGKPENSVIAEQNRSQAKSVNFGLCFQQGPTALAAKLGKSVSEAKALQDKILDAYSGLKKWLAETKIESLNRGYTESAFGRRRRFPLITNNSIKASFERAAVNHPAQSTASDICLLAAIEVDNTFDPDDLAVLLLTHDDLLFECREDKLDELVPKVVEIQQKHWLENRGITFVAEPKIMDRWAKKFEEEEDELPVEDVPLEEEFALT